MLKKLFMILIILLISYLGSQKILAVKMIRAQATQVKEVSTLMTREVWLSKAILMLPKSTLLDVPLINQMEYPKLFNGCEVTSMAMILQYHGMNVTKNELAAKVKKVPLTYSNGQKGNPNAGFVGDMANGPGLGVYHGPMMELTRTYVGDKGVDLSGSPFTDLLKKVTQELPVWIITTTRLAPVSVFETWDTPQGKIEITFNEHSVVITGFDEHYIYINDPYGTKNKKVNRENFIKAWEQMGKQAIVIDKLAKAEE